MGYAYGFQGEGATVGNMRSFKRAVKRNRLAIGRAAVRRIAKKARSK